MSDDHGHGHGHGHESEVDSALARVEALSNEKVHHAGDHEGPFSVHVLGLGPCGAAVISELAGSGLPGFSAVAVDVGQGSLSGLAAGGSVRAVELPIPSREDLSSALNRYREFLKMEYPRYYWNPNYEPWLPGDLEIPASGAEMSRAVAKAVYGAEYYQNREITEALDGFAESVLASEHTPLVVVAFSLAEAVGSGIVVEIARHLSSIKLGRRPWVVGMGVLPQEVDATFFPVINELDCMIDTEKNNGVMAVWGDLYKNPFTGGFFVVPDDGVHSPVEAIASFCSVRGGRDLYETLKALNWLAVPGDQWHPAIRGQQSDRWVNVLVTRPLEEVDSLAGVGLVEGFSTEYAEARVFGGGKRATAAAKAVGAAIAGVATTRVDPVVETVAADNEFVGVVLPRASKLDLEMFVPARAAYDAIEDWEEHLLMHSWLLDLGVMLCEPSIRFDGMGGECIWGCACWVVVPHAAIRGETVVSVVDELDPAVAVSG
ncbi:hypothetical protein [Pseudonocardia dioxanivorans]|uniref:Tubulin/FtsZ GTPase n=1 Tax=Pseudonocardia dioxanivorans (strain ATCC 55486 / DSM 44775 / JCM 13855 / CB1190) TaxID=675635 RepID=F4CLI4_PSEUX|nr:hypothetical protein [Pseudonocardia dioxanivorans]AEA27037.1 hypothetical protein Psed_4894 [Pseudonocardia dioxanivorans CB1190]